MNRKDLQRTVARAQQKLQELELKALNAERVAKTAKAKAKQLKLEHRRARKMAKQANRFAAVMAEEAKEQCRVLEKAERRLAKALKKRRARQPTVNKAPVGTTTRAFGLVRAVLPKVAPGRGRSVPAGSRRAAGNGHGTLVSP